MINFTIHGSCAGTQPFAGHRHTSYTMEIGGKVYWIDAGENCAYAAHLSGIDLLSTRAVFITHPHMDHVGGLGNLFWYMRKMTYVDKVRGAEIAGNTVSLRISELRSWEGILQMLKCTEGDFITNFNIEAAPVIDGEIYRDENMTVRAIHNTHLPRTDDGRWRSFSFDISADGKRIVCCGDIKHYEELGDVYEGADLIFVETGHHKVENVCSWFAEHGYHFGKLVFVHNGKQIRSDYDNALALARSIVGDRVILSRDGMRFSL